MSEKNTANKPKITIKEMVLTALMAVLITVCSWITIPAAVPFTLQTFAVFCSLRLIGGRNTLFSIIVYLLMGAIGIPVFSGLKGGFGVILGSTGGYMLGFILLAIVYMISEKIPFNNKASRIVIDIAAMITGMILCYTFGTLWFIKVYTANNGSIGIHTALKWCIIPFIPFDLIKLVISVIITERIKTFIKL